MKDSELKGHYAVIFTSKRNERSVDEYEKMAERMVSLAKEQMGFLGIVTVRGTDGIGITVSYWNSLESIQKWKANAEHLTAQKKGKEIWYSGFSIQICRIERDYSFGTMA